MNILLREKNAAFSYESGKDLFMRENTKNKLPLRSLIHSSANRSTAPSTWNTLNSILKNPRFELLQWIEATEQLSFCKLFFPYCSQKFQVSAARDSRDVRGFKIHHHGSESK